VYRHEIKNPPNSGLLVYDSPTVAVYSAGVISFSGGLIGGLHPQLHQLKKNY